MGEAFFELSAEDQGEALETAAARSGQPAYLLEKDIWVVWSLSVLFDTSMGRYLSFKGGTSLSKAYGLIDRFSEDIDLTYDIRTMLPELAGDGDGIPASRSQGQKWTEAVRRKLPDWMDSTIKPLLTDAVARQGIPASLQQEGQDRLFIEFPVHREGYGYVKPAVMLEFGARSTGEPAEVHTITCDAAPFLPEVTFPIARARVMKVERTFWEKATAAHVFCAQAKLKGERFARHWHDLAALANSDYFDQALSDREIAETVARQKAVFFREKAADGTLIDYKEAVNGALRIVPEGEAQQVLADDYARMIDAGLLHTHAAPFDDLMQACTRIQDQANDLAW
ncbi:nucleotidyl transferase AbiEii/AbiGii toxin family protein [Fodinicurvata fenggangensis]|uniref:nucleotidyl transferase AbiEii/AbiGii toxin family protein n=1 Tax=Fodinicurvata fenggangensis TaxID=1121830 RepID=UPI00047D5ECB|nr:nucleotidyl transferase AbiEii/AbiGii toxin family protein [Fodinicurvata fenggangensis]